AAVLATLLIRRVTSKVTCIKYHKPSAIRPHTPTIAQNKSLASIGTKTLRQLELDGTREVGIIFRDAKIVSRIHRIFEEDWCACEKPEVPMAAEETAPTVKIANKVAKALTKELPPVAPLLNGAVKEIVGEKEMDLNVQ